MGALPNSLPKPSHKPPQSDRAPLDRLRTSDYDRQTGYAPLFFSLMADLPRLSSGNACTLLVLQVVCRSWGRHPGDNKTKRDEWTLPTSIQDWATLCACDVRTVEREIAGLEKRKMAETKRTGRGTVALRLLARDWPALPDYHHANVVEISTGKEAEEETTEKQAAGGNAVLTKKPVAAPAGKSSRSIPVNTGVKAFRFQNDSPIVDLSFTAMVQAGELIVRSQVPDAWLKTAAKKIGRSNGTNDLADLSRHPCRDTFASHSPSTAKSPTGESKAKRRTSGETTLNIRTIHPRAAEICSLFDPILLKSQTRLLSADSGSLAEACEAVGQTDHNYLLKFVMQRADRPVNSPKHVRHIVAEAAKNWAKVKDLPASQQFSPGKKTSFVESTKAEILRRVKKGTF